MSLLHSLARLLDQGANDVKRAVAPSGGMPAPQPVQKVVGPVELRNVNSPLMAVGADTQLPTAPVSKEVTLFNGGMRFGHDPTVKFPDNEADPSIFTQSPDGTIIAPQDVLGHTFTGNIISSPVMHTPVPHYKQPPMYPGTRI